MAPEITITGGQFGVIGEGATIVNEPAQPVENAQNEAKDLERNNTLEVSCPRCGAPNTITVTSGGTIGQLRSITCVSCGGESKFPKDSEIVQDIRELRDKLRREEGEDIEPKQTTNPGKYNISLNGDAQVGPIGDNQVIEGGIHFGSKPISKGQVGSVGDGTRVKGGIHFGS